MRPRKHPQGNFPNATPAHGTGPSDRRALPFETLREGVVFRILLPLSHECWKRPRGGSAGWYLQMTGHNILGDRTNLRTGLGPRT